MKFNIEHLNSCLDQFKQGKISKDELEELLSNEEKNFIDINQWLVDELSTVEKEPEELENDCLEPFMMMVESDLELCSQAEIIVGQLGLDMASAISLFLTQLVLQKKLPFEVTTEKLV